MIKINKQSGQTFWFKNEQQFKEFVTEKTMRDLAFLTDSPNISGGLIDSKTQALIIYTVFIDRMIKENFFNPSKQKISELISAISKVQTIVKKYLGTNNQIYKQISTLAVFYTSVKKQMIGQQISNIRQEYVHKTLTEEQRLKSLDQITQNQLTKKKKISLVKDSSFQISFQRKNYTFSLVSKKKLQTNVVYCSFVIILSHLEVQFSLYVIPRSEVPLSIWGLGNDPQSVIQKLELQSRAIQLAQIEARFKKQRERVDGGLSRLQYNLSEVKSQVQSVKIAEDWKKQTQKSLSEWKMQWQNIVNLHDDKITNLVRSYEKTREQIQQHETRLNIKFQEINLWKEQLQRKNIELEQYKVILKKIEKAQSDIGILSLQLKDLNQRDQEMRKVFSQKIKQLQNQGKMSRIKVNQLESEIMQTNKSIKAINKGIQEINAERMKQKNEIRQLQHNLTLIATKQQIKNSQTKIDKEIKQLKRNYSDFSKQIQIKDMQTKQMFSKVNSKIQETKEDLIEYHKKIEDEVRKIKRQTSQIVQLSLRNEITNEVKNIQNNLKQMTKEMQQLQKMTLKSINIQAEQKKIKGQVLSLQKEQRKKNNESQTKVKNIQKLFKEFQQRSKRQSTKIGQQINRIKKEIENYNRIQEKLNDNIQSFQRYKQKNNTTTFILEERVAQNERKIERIKGVQKKIKQNLKNMQIREHFEKQPLFRFEVLTRPNLMKQYMKAIKGDSEQ